MNELTVFNHEQFGALPVIIWEGVEYFDPDVVAAALGYSNTRNLLQIFDLIP